MLEERAAYSQLIRDNIDYDYLIELHSSDTGQIDELVSLMTDVVCSTKPTIRVNGEEMPQQFLFDIFSFANVYGIRAIVLFTEEKIYTWLRQFVTVT